MIEAILKLADDNLRYAEALAAYQKAIELAPEDQRPTVKSDMLIIAPVRWEAIGAAALPVVNEEFRLR